MSFAWWNINTTAFQAHLNSHTRTSQYSGGKKRDEREREREKTQLADADTERG